MGISVRWLFEVLTSYDLEHLTVTWVTFEFWVAIVALVFCHHGLPGHLVDRVIRIPRLVNSHAPLTTSLEQTGHRIFSNFLGLGLLTSVFLRARNTWAECLLELQGQRKSTYRISRALNWEELQYRVAFVRLARFVPTLLIGIGILGTFAGLTAGTRDVQLGDEQQLSQNVLNVLNGMNLAFVTSIFGIGLSLVWNLAHRTIMGICRSGVVKLGQRLDLEYATWSDDELNRALVADQLQQTATLKTMSTDLATQLTESMQKVLDEGFAEPMSSFLSRMETLQADSLSSIASGVSESINKVVGAEFESLKAVLQDLIELHEKTATHLTTTVDVLQRSGEFNQALLERMDETAKRTEIYTSSMQELQGLIKDSGQRMQEAAHAVAEAASISSKASATQRELIEDVSRNLDEAQRTWQNTEVSLKKLTSDLNTVIGSFKENIETTITKSHSQFDDLMSEAVGRLSGTVSEMSSASDEVTTAVLQLTKHTKNLNQELVKQQGIYTKAGQSIEMISRQIELSLNDKEQAK